VQEQGLVEQEGLSQQQAGSRRGPGCGRAGSSRLGKADCCRCVQLPQLHLRSMLLAQPGYAGRARASPGRA
jgi:hypothetical protein